VHCVADCITGRVIPQPTEWQRIGNQINAATILARADFVSATQLSPLELRLCLNDPWLI